MPKRKQTELPEELTTLDVPHSEELNGSPEPAKKKMGWAVTPLSPEDWENKTELLFKRIDILVNQLGLRRQYATLHLLINEYENWAQQELDRIEAAEKQKRDEAFEKLQAMAKKLGASVSIPGEDSGI